MAGRADGRPVQAEERKRLVDEHLGTAEALVVVILGRASRSGSERAISGGHQTRRSCGPVAWTRHECRAYPDCPVNFEARRHGQEYPRSSARCVRAANRQA